MSTLHTPTIVLACWPADKTCGAVWRGEPHPRSGESRAGNPPAPIKNTKIMYVILGIQPAAGLLNPKRKIYELDRRLKWEAGNIIIQYSVVFVARLSITLSFLF